MRKGDGKIIIIETVCKEQFSFNIPFMLQAQMCIISKNQMPSTTSIEHHQEMYFIRVLSLALSLISLAMWIISVVWYECIDYFLYFFLLFYFVFGIQLIWFRLISPAPVRCFRCVRVLMTFNAKSIVVYRRGGLMVFV